MKKNINLRKMIQENLNTEHHEHKISGKELDKNVCRECAAKVRILNRLARRGVISRVHEETWVINN